MRKTELSFTKTDSAKTDSRVGLSELAHQAGGWLLDGDIRHLSSKTLSFRRLLLDKLLWFLRQKEFTECGVMDRYVSLAQGDLENQHRQFSPLDRMKTR